MVEVHQTIHHKSFMRKIILTISFFHMAVFLVAQVTSRDTLTTEKKQDDAYHEYSLLKNFLSLQKNKPGVIMTGIKSSWNFKLYREQYQQALEINKKKEFYPVIIFDSRFVAQSIPVRYGSQNYMWVSTQPKYNSLGGQIASDVVGGILNSKKHWFNTNNKKGYYTPSGLKY